MLHLEAESKINDQVYNIQYITLKHIRADFHSFYSQSKNDLNVTFVLPDDLIFNLTGTYIISRETSYRMDQLFSATPRKNRRKSDETLSSS